MKYVHEALVVGSFELRPPSFVLLDLAVDGSKEVPDQCEPFTLDVVEFPGVFEYRLMGSCDELNPVEVDLDRFTKR